MPLSFTLGLVSVGPLLRFPSNLLRHRDPSLNVISSAVASSAPPPVQIDSALGLVRQVRTPFFHPCNPRISIRRVLPFLIRHSLLAPPIQPRHLLALQGRQGITRKGAMESMRRSYESRGKCLANLTVLTSAESRQSNYGLHLRRLGTTPWI